MTVKRKLITILEEHVEWLENNAISLSKYVRKKIEEDINNEEKI